jgi:hypothetical protein
MGLVMNMCLSYSDFLLFYLNDITSVLRYETVVDSDSTYNRVHSH